MEQSQLIELIRTLSPEEAAHVREFAGLSFFNNSPKKKKVLPLLEICLTNAQQDSAPPLDKRAVYTLLFPGNEFHEGTLEKVMVEAHKVVRAFVGLKHYYRKGNEFHQNLDFAEAVRRRGLEGRFNQIRSRLQKQQEESGQNGLVHYYRQYHLEYAEHYVASLNNQKRGDLNIPNLIQSVESFYYIRMAALLDRYLLQLRVTKLDVPDFVQQHLDNLTVPEMYLSESPPLRIYFEIFKVLKKLTPETEDIRSLFDLLQLHQRRVDEETLQEFYGYLRNFVTLKLSADPENIELRSTLHEIYIDNLERGYLIYEGKLSPSRFFSIYDNAIRIQALEWAHGFIEAYKGKIHGENPGGDTYRLANAQYQFALGNFDECLDNIPDISPHIDQLLQCKRLELKALYETRSDLFPYKLDAFKMYLSRSGEKLLSAQLKQKNLDFANSLFRMSRPSSSAPKSAQRQSKKLLENKGALEWAWLLQKVEVLG